MTESMRAQEKKQIACIHVYCGDGKGKTTAAIGLAIRAAGAGKQVLFSQFMKGGQSSELQILKEIPNIRLMRSEKRFPFYEYMSAEQKQELTDIHNGMLQKMIESLDAGSKGETATSGDNGFRNDRSARDELVWRPDVIIMDEITYPYNWELLNRSLFQQFLTQAKGRVELVLTGRDPAEEILQAADYITEMRKLRHPYDQGIPARIGIEL